MPVPAVGVTRARHSGRFQSETCSPIGLTLSNLGRKHGSSDVRLRKICKMLSGASVAGCDGLGRGGDAEARQPKQPLQSREQHPEHAGARQCAR
jgi:hypothetical protein